MSMLILYAEDDLDDFDFFTEIIQTMRPEATCVNVRSGHEALEFLETAIQLPEVIFLDINMPAMDGKACLKHIVKSEKFSAIPVFIYTTSANPQDVDLCKQLGARDYIQKPTSIKDGIGKLSPIINP